MEIIQLVVLSVTQGALSFYQCHHPRIIMISQFFGWKDQGMVIDTMAHLGSLFGFFIHLF